MTNTITVKSHSRRKPEKAPDPFSPAIEAKRSDFCRKWNLDLVGANDDRLAAPIAHPVVGPARMPIEKHRSLLQVLARMVGRR